MGNMSFDLGRIELGGDKNLDNVPIERLRREIIAQYERGGMVSLSWHTDNPVTGKDAWDVSDSTVVASVLPGGAQHDKFMGWMGTIADFMNSLTTSDGRKVPVLFRPWHEHTGSWFWWGQALCSATEYKALWRMTYEFMQQKGVKHLLYAYSPGTEPNNTAEYLERIDLAFACADLVICRAGAGSVSELAALGLPAIYVPLPIGNGEQRFNAEPVVNAGGGLLVADKDLTPQWVHEHVPDLLADHERLAEFGRKAWEYGIRNAAEIMARHVLQLAEPSK